MRKKIPIPENLDLTLTGTQTAKLYGVGLHIALDWLRKSGKNLKKGRCKLPDGRCIADDHWARKITSEEWEKTDSYLSRKYETSKQRIHQIREAFLKEGMIIRPKLKDIPFEVKEPWVSQVDLTQHTSLVKKEAGVTRYQIKLARKKLGIICSSKSGPPALEIPEGIDLSLNSRELAKSYGVSFRTVEKWRKIRGVRGTCKPHIRISATYEMLKALTPEEWAQGSAVIAKRTGLTTQYVIAARCKINKANKGSHPPKLK